MRKKKEEKKQEYTKPKLTAHGKVKEVIMATSGGYDYGTTGY